MSVPPEIGDLTAWVVGMPGPDIDYALCIGRDGDKALLRFQVWQGLGPWRERLETVTGSMPYGCWKTERLEDVKDGLLAEQKRLFPIPDPAEGMTCSKTRIIGKTL